MRKLLAPLMASLLIILAGCSEAPTTPHDADGSEDGDDDGQDGHGGQDDASGGNATLVPALEASAVNGSAPLQVTFNVSAQGASPNATWTLAFGDGNATNGTTLPSTANHMFQGGNFTVTLTVTDRNATATAQIALAVASGEEPLTLPATTHWVLGQAAGCIWDLATEADGPPIPCAGLVAGPDAPAVTDGHWITLGEAYVGLQLVSTIDRGDGHGSSADGWPLYDSDCWFVAADGETQTGDGHNGGGACAGIIPEGTKYVFVAPYGLPAIEMIVDVQLPA